MTPYKHAESSSVKYGGKPSEYIELHDWFDEAKQYTDNWTHRALRHHAAGIQRAVEKFGPTIGKNKIPTKLLAEQHVMEDCGYIPTVADWLRALLSHPEDWVLKVKVKTVEKIKLK